VRVALLRGLSRGPEQFPDPSPRQTAGPRCFDGFDNLSFGPGAGQRGPTKQVLGHGGLISGVGFVVLEPFGEFVGVVKDFLDGSGHGHHRRNLLRAGMA
jgi:hypothetical protein